MEFIQSEKLIRYIDASYNFIQNIENIKSYAKFDLSKKEKKQQYEYFDEYPPLLLIKELNKRAWQKRIP